MTKADDRKLDMLARAIAIAAEVHGPRRDDNGDPRILRTLRAMMMVDGEEAQTVAVLREVLASTREWTVERLRAEGFPEGILGKVTAEK
jgi:hypothetical protein